MSVEELKKALEKREAECATLRQKVQEAMKNGDLESVKKYTAEIFRISMQPLF